ncbi:MAG: tetratricopeptide repeat protein [Alphaproteobacteria bacterium]|nr:tetratricopeptide repeat protein [Alphaproteobacteria bacterium]
MSATSVEALRQALVAAPIEERAALRNDIAVALAAAGEAEAAEAEWRAAIAEAPFLAAAHINLGNHLRARGRIDEALACLGAAMASDPDSPQARNALALACKAKGANAEALAHFQWLVRVSPDYVEGRLNHAMLLQEIGDPSAALAEVDAAIAVGPASPEAAVLRANLLKVLGRIEAAREAGEAAVAAWPDFAPAQHELGCIYLGRGLTGKAIAVLRRAIELRADFPEAHNYLGNAYQSQGTYAAAIEEYRLALAQRPDNLEVLNNLGCALGNQGYQDEAIAILKRVLDLDPNYAQAYSNLIFSLDMVQTDPREAHAVRRAWAARFADPLMPPILDHPNRRDPEKRLRVGYVSSDFRRHSAAFIFGALIAHHDKARFEVICYSGTTTPDDMTEEIKRQADHWRETAGMDDAAVAAKVREDGVDILVDLAGHSAGGRLGVFARKPAPVQVTGWGYGLGTGLMTIDYVMLAASAVPPLDPPPFSEKPWILPVSLAYHAPKDAPEVAPPPCLATGRVTFGCFNRATKLSRQSLDVFAEILATTPGSRLIIKDISFNDVGAKERVEAAFRERDIDPARIEVLGWTPHFDHLATYGRVDLMLDPFPHGGGTSFLDALWMGVPVLTLQGLTVQARNGATLARMVGLDDLVVENTGAYVEAARGWASRPTDLAALRPVLRQRVARSPIGDSVAYARAADAAFRAMWRRWCAGAG